MIRQSEAKSAFMKAERLHPHHLNPMVQQSKRKMAGGGEVFTNALRKVAVFSRLPSWFSRDWLWGLILVLAVVLVYQPVWYAGFIWDDDHHLTANPCIIGPLGLKEVWTT